MESFVSAFSILRNVVIPSDRLWIKNKISVMKWLRTLSVQMCFVWIACFSIVSFITSGLPGHAGELLILKEWSISGIVFASGSAILAHIATFKRFWASKGQRITFGKWHIAFSNKMRRMPMVTRILDRALFTSLVSMILIILFMSAAPRMVMTLLNLKILG